MNTSPKAPQDPVVSVIIPAYNAEATLGLCLDSVLANSFFDFEVIIIDDGSCDATSELAEHYAQKDARLRIMRQQNAGVSASRNKGIAEAKGRYLCFIDVDDTVAPNYIERLVSVMDEHSLDWLACSYWRQQDQRGTHKTSDAPAFTKEVFACGEAAQSLACQSVFSGKTGRNNLASACFGMYRRSLIQAHQIHFFEDLSIGEDMHFNYQVAHVLNGFGYICERLYFYTSQTDSAMKTLDLKSFLESHEKLVRKLDELHQAYGGDDSAQAGRVFFYKRIIYALHTYVFSLKSAAERKQAYQMIEQYLFDHGVLQAYLEQKKRGTVHEIPFDSLRLYLLQNHRFETYYRFWANPLWRIKRGLVNTTKRIINAGKRT